MGAAAPHKVGLFSSVVAVSVAGLRAILGARRTRLGVAKRLRAVGLGVAVGIAVARVVPSVGLEGVRRVRVLPRAVGQGAAPRSDVAVVPRRVGLVMNETGTQHYVVSDICLRRTFT